MEEIKSMINYMWRILIPSIHILGQNFAAALKYAVSGAPLRAPFGCLEAIYSKSVALFTPAVNLKFSIKS